MNEFILPVIVIVTSHYVGPEIPAQSAGVKLTIKKNYIKNSFKTRY